MLEYIVIGIYLVFMIVIGLVFSRLNRSNSDYFRGGSQGTWWLCGINAYMSATSAYTFTAAAGIAFSAGWSILLIYLGGPIGNILLYFFYAARCRQKRLTTPGEVMRERFNPATQQTYTIIGLLTGFVGSGLTLYTLCIFVSAVFGLPMVGTIVVLGAVVVFYSIASGRWGVMATDFLQCLVMFAMTILVSILALIHAGGISAFFSKIGELGLTRDFQLFNPMERFGGYYTWEWTLALFFVTTITNFSVANANYTVKDGREAEKALLLTTGLSLAGCIFFFIPPFAARFFYAGEVNALSMLANPADGAYAVACLNLLPAGMVGLVVVAMFSAAMSTMDASLNAGAGNFMLNVYPPLKRIFGWRERSESEMLQVSRMYSLVAGVIAVTLSILYSYSGVGPLKVVLTAGALLGLPMAVPMFWGLLLKRMPQWTPIAAMCVGFFGSIFLWVSEQSGRISWYYHEQVLFNIVVPTLAVFVSMFFARRNSAEYNNRVDGFFRRMNTPVDFAAEVGEGNDAMQLRLLGRFAVAGGSFIMLLAVAARSLSGVLCPLAVGGGIALLGYAMIRAARRVGAKP